MKKLSVLVLLSLIVPFFAFARGPNDGGGGGAIVCLNPDLSIKSAKLVDLEEGHFYENLRNNTELVSLDWNEQISRVASRYGAMDPAFNQWLQSTILFILSDHMEEVPNKVFPAPEDLSHGRVPPMDLGCQLMGAAVYSDNADRLYLSSPIFQAFSDTDKAALILHESLYLMQRKMRGSLPPPDSSDVRRVVAFLFSDQLGQANLDTERARFVKPGPYFARGEYDFYQLVTPKFLEFRQENLAKPLYLDEAVCSRHLKIVTYAKPGQCKLVAKNRYGFENSHVRDLSNTMKIESEQKISYDYTPTRQNDGSIDAEDLMLSCKLDSPNDNAPGFDIFCGSNKIAQVDYSYGTNHKMPAGITIYDKIDYAKEFLSNLSLQF